MAGTRILQASGRTDNGRSAHGHRRSRARITFRRSNRRHREYENAGANSRRLPRVTDLCDELVDRVFGVGSLLTLVGIYGVISLSVASRRRELAIRSAVGAQQSDIRRLIFGEGFRLIAGGVLGGIASAIIVSRVLQSFLFGVQPGDPITFIVVSALFLGVGLLACWAPVRRAGKVDPLEALRYE